MALRIRLCGGLVAELGGKPIEPQLAGRQGREVFAYLVLHRGRPVSRDELAALLWPDRPPRSPEAALNTILARLRRILGHAVLPARAQLSLELPPQSWIDVEAAEEAALRAETLLAEESAAEALELAGSAMDIVAATLLPEVQHAWIDQRRSEVDDVGSRLLTVTVRCGLMLGGARLVDSDRAAHRLIEREPFRESGYAMLMEVRAARGDVAEALLVYERLRVLLRDELGIPPSARVAALHDRLLGEGSSRGSAAPVPSHGREEPEDLPSVPLPGLLARSSERRLVGRDPELAVLRQRWSELAADNRCVIALEGEPGIGKTTLAASFAREAHRSGANVLYGRAEEEAIVPYAPLVEALRHYVVHRSDFRFDQGLGIHLSELGWLIPELADHRAEPRVSTDDPRFQRMRLYQAVAALVAHAASQRPVLLVLEDLQWADADTLLILRQVLREATPRPVLALVTYRASEVAVDHALWRVLSEFHRALGVTRLALRGLGDEAIADLLGNGDRPRAEFVQRLREHTSGNPFFVEEVLRSLRESGSGKARDLSIDDLVVLPEGVQDVIQDRLRRLDPPTRDALAAAAVLGHDFDIEMLESVVDDDRLAHALDAAVRAGLVLDQSQPGEGYRFRHALGREAIYRSIGRSRRAQLHVRAARALEQRRQLTDVDAAQLAHHFVESDRSEVADEAIAYSREAAEKKLETHAYQDAAHHYRRALEVLERHRAHDLPMRCSLLRGLGAVCWQGSGPGARVIFEQAVAVARGLGEHSHFAEAALGLGGRFYAPTGPDEPYIALLEEALPWVRDDDALRARLLGRQAEHLIFVDANRAARLSAEALEVASRLRDPSVLAAALLSRHAALLHVRHLDERRRLATDEVELARRHGLGELEALGHHWLLYDLLEAGDVIAATASRRRLQALADELCQPLYRHSGLVWGRVLEQLSGRFERAARLAHEALNVAQGAHGEDANTHFLAQQLGVVHDQGGEERLLRVLEQRTTGGQPLWSAAACLLEPDGADGSVVQRAFDALTASTLFDLPRDVFWLTTLAWLAEASARVGDPERTAVLYEILAPFADCFVQLTFNGSFGCVHRHLGLLAGTLGRPRQAAEHFEEALRRHAAIPAPALEARTYCDYAESVLADRAAGSTRDARLMIERAGRLAEACGATKISQRQRRLLPRGAPQPVAAGRSG
jgi:DNA-binding SARP family transcriptional activator/tetratricopeptide (TPR) repeat protein